MAPELMLGAYLLGSVPGAYVIGRLSRGMDIRHRDAWVFSRPEEGAGHRPADRT